MAEGDLDHDQSIDDILGDLIRLKKEHQKTTETFRQRIDEIEKKLKERKPPMLQSR